MSDESGTMRWTYDAQGRLASAMRSVGALNFGVQYAYDAAGRLVQTTYPSGHAVSYGYLGDRVSAVSVAGQSLIDHVRYQPFGGVAGWLWGDGSASQRGFDASGRVASYTLGGGAVRSIQRDAAGRITQIGDSADPSRTQSFAYDGLDRLTSYSSGNAPSQSYVYDAGGNRTAARIGGIDYSYAYASPTTNFLAQVAGPIPKAWELHRRQSQQRHRRHPSFRARFVSASERRGGRGCRAPVPQQRIRPACQQARCRTGHRHPLRLRPARGVAGRARPERRRTSRVHLAGQPSGGRARGRPARLHPHRPPRHSEADHPAGRPGAVALGIRPLRQHRGRHQPRRPGRLRLQPALCRPVLRRGERPALQRRPATTTRSPGATRKATRSASPGGSTLTSTPTTSPRCRPMRRASARSASQRW